MDVSVKELAEHVLCLSVTERERLTSNLLQSIHCKELATDECQWLSVVVERFLDLESEKDVGILVAEFLTLIGLRTVEGT